MTFKIDGMDEALEEFNDAVAEIKGKTVEGLLAGALIILGEAQRRVPVEYGNLRASGYAARSAADPNVVDVGFTASYAAAIHENLEQRLKGRPRPSGLGVYWGPHGQPKYLESAMIDKRDEVVEAVASRAQVSGGQRGRRS